MLIALFESRVQRVDVRAFNQIIALQFIRMLSTTGTRIVDEIRVKCRDRRPVQKRVHFVGDLCIDDFHIELKTCTGLNSTVLNKKLGSCPVGEAKDRMKSGRLQMLDAHLNHKIRI